MPRGRDSRSWRDDELRAWPPQPTRSAIASTKRGRLYREALEPVAVGPGIEALARDPVRVIVRAKIALPRIADEGDDRARAPLRDRLLGEGERAIDIGSGRAAALSADDRLEPMDRGGVGRADHPVDDARDQGCFDARAPDPLDPRTSVDAESPVAGRKGIEEHRVLGIDDAEPRRRERLLAVADIAADRRRRTARPVEVGFDQANRVLDPVAVDRQWAAVAHFDGRRG